MSISKNSRTTQRSYANEDTPITLRSIEGEERRSAFQIPLASAKRLKRNTPERSIGFSQFEPGVPRFVVAPHNERLGLAASFWMDQSNLLVHRQGGSDDRHAAGVADVNRNGVGS